MPQRLTQGDWQRIRTFANTAPHLRTPEMLVPENVEDVEDAENADGG